MRGLSLRRRDDERRGVGGIEMVDYTDGNRFCIGDDVLQSIAKTETLPELCRETKFNVIWEALNRNQIETATAAGKSFMRILYYFLKDNLEGYSDGTDMNKLIYSIFYHCMGVDSEQKKTVFKRVKWKVALESIIAVVKTGQSPESRGRSRVLEATKSETSGSSSGPSGSESRRRRSASRSRSPSTGGIDDEIRKIRDKIIQLVSTGRSENQKFVTTHHETNLKLQHFLTLLAARRGGGGKKMKTIKKQKRKKKTKRKRKRRKKKTIKRRRKRGRKTRRK